MGCGHISQAHLRGWKRVPNCQVAGVMDVNNDLARQRAEQFEVPTVYDDLDEAIAAADVVDVCTPPQTHAGIAEPVLRAGRKLVIEKPVVLTVQEWAPLRALAGDDEGAITVIHNFKFLHSVQRARAWIDEGRIGAVVSIRHEFLVSPGTDRMLAQAALVAHASRWPVAGDIAALPLPDPFPGRCPRLRLGHRGPGPDCRRTGDPGRREPPRRAVLGRDPVLRHLRAEPAGDHGAGHRRPDRRRLAGRHPDHRQGPRRPSRPGRRTKHARGGVDRPTGDPGPDRLRPATSRPPDPSTRRSCPPSAATPQDRARRRHLWPRSSTWCATATSSAARSTPPSTAVHPVALTGRRRPPSRSPAAARSPRLPTEAVVGVAGPAPHRGDLCSSSAGPSSQSRTSESHGDSTSAVPAQRRVSG